MISIRRLITLALTGPALTLACISAPIQADETTRLIGAGASFPAPLYQRWFRDYAQAHPGVLPDYQALGSGAGVAALRDGRVDFAGSDQPLPPEESTRIPGGLLQVPMIAGAVILAYNLPGIDELKLSREAVSAIFQGKVSHWNDPVVRQANPGVDLPDTPLTLVARADSSGTTLVITRHLSAISPDLASALGTSMTPDWPGALKQRGALVRGRGNGGVAASIQAIPGAIGYLSYSYAALTDIQMASLQNAEGQFVAPDGDTFKTAIAAFKADPDPSDIADPPGAGAYPILTVSWLLARKDLEGPKLQALIEVIRYCLTEGRPVATQLGYIPLTKATITRLLETLEPKA